MNQPKVSGGESRKAATPVGSLPTKVPAPPPSAFTLKHIKLFSLTSKGVKF
jgi:hypothetical protein